MSEPVSGPSMTFEQGWRLFSLLFVMLVFTVVGTGVSAYLGVALAEHEAAKAPDVAETCAGKLSGYYLRVDGTTHMITAGTATNVLPVPTGGVP